MNKAFADEAERQFDALADAYRARRAGLGARAVTPEPGSLALPKPPIAKRR
ncbi:MAG: hypothetical protein ACYC8T_16815 [Myxococcaceae bacterium]